MAMASFSPLVHDNGVGKDTGSRRRRDHLRQQLSDREPFGVLSDPDYVSAVCGKAVGGDATCRILPHLLDAMGMEIVKQKNLPSQIPSHIGGCKETDNAAGEVEALDPMNVSVRPKKKNPDHTLATVREFALTQVAVRNSLVDNSTERGCSKEEGHDMSVLDEIFSAFRIAAHHTIIYADETLGDLSSSSIAAERKQKVADNARRALMTCFVTLRGLLLRLAELADEERNEGKPSGARSIGVIFGEGFDGRSDASGAPSVVEGVLLDIVPLLTQFFHPPLGEKRACSLLQNLLSLDETARKKKRSSKVDKKRQMCQEEDARDDLLAKQINTVIVRDSLMEVFVRQLFEQESEAKRKLGRELLNVTISGVVSMIDVGAVAALRSKMTRPEVQDMILAHRNCQSEKMERRWRIVEAQHDGPSWDHEYQSLVTKRKRFLPLNSVDYGKVDLHLLRLDGCIYLSRIAARILTKRNAKSISSGTRSATEGKDDSQEGPEATDSLTPTPHQSLQTTAMTPSSKNGWPGDGIGSKQNSSGSVDLELEPARPGLSLKNASFERDQLMGADDVQAQRERICCLAYFLFHTLMDHYAQAESEGDNKTTKIRREDIPSASLACYLLAGKMEECPVKVRTLLNMIKSVGLPPPPSARIEKCCKRLKDIVEMNGSSTSVKKLSLEWGNPTPEVMKQYEMKLLSILGFNFLYGEGWIHPSTYIYELGEALSLDADAIDHVKGVMNDSSYTHSSLCLLGEPKLVTAAMYYLSCDKTDRDLHEHWDELLGEDGGLVNLVANYAWEVRNCACAREKQWQTFEEFKLIFDEIRQSVKHHSSRQEFQLTDDTKPIPSLFKLNVNHSDFDCFSPPQPLSHLVDKMNSYLAELDRLDASSFDEANIQTDAAESVTNASPEANGALPIQELRLPDSVSMEIKPSVEQSHARNSEVSKTEDADDDQAKDVSKSTLANDGEIVDAENTCAHDTSTIDDSVEVEEGSSQIGEDSGDAGIAAGCGEEAPAIETVSSAADTAKHAARTKKTTSMPSEDENISGSTDSDKLEPLKGDGAKNPIASTPAHLLATPAIMSEESKPILSSPSNTTKTSAKMTVQSKRGRDSKDQSAEMESQSKRRMLKMPSSRPALSNFAPKKEAVPPETSPSRAPQAHTSSSKSQVSANTLSHSSSEQQVFPQNSKKKQRLSPGGTNGRTESPPQTAPPQTKRKMRSPGEQPMPNQPSNQHCTPYSKKQKTSESASTPPQSIPTNRRAPKMRFGKAAFAGMMSHLGMSGDGTSSRQISKREEVGAESLARPPTFDDDSPPNPHKVKTSQSKTTAPSKPNTKKREGEDAKNVMRSVSYRFTIDDHDSTSPSLRGQTAQNITKPKPTKKKKKTRGQWGKGR